MEPRHAMIGPCPHCGAVPCSPSCKWAAAAAVLFEMEEDDRRPRKCPDCHRTPPFERWDMKPCARCRFSIANLGDRFMTNATEADLAREGRWGLMTIFADGTHVISRFDGDFGDETDRHPNLGDPRERPRCTCHRSAGYHQLECPRWSIDEDRHSCRLDDLEVAVYRALSAIEAA